MIGYRFFIDSGVRWRNNQGGLFLLSPPNRLEYLDRKSAKSLLKSSGELFVRWETDFDQMAESDWWHVIRDETLSLESLSSNTRSKVRRGLKTFECKPVLRDDILRLGYKVYKKAFTRYETHEKIYTPKEFSKAITSLPEDTEFWGVWSKSTYELVAFSENYVESQTCFYNTIWFDPSALRQYSSYALFFEMTRHYLGNRGFKYVSDGARSLSHQTQIHDFLESKFGFRKAYARLCVIYAPLFGGAITFAYPFRNQIKKIPFGLFQKASIVLKQEEIRRHSERVVR